MRSTAPSADASPPSSSHRTSVHASAERTATETARKAVAEELQLLRDPSGLAAAGLLLTCVHDNYSGTLEWSSSSSLPSASPSFGTGRLIFSLEELSLHTTWQTPAGHYLCRVDDYAANYFIDPTVHALLGNLFMYLCIYLFVCFSCYVFIQFLLLLLRICTFTKFFFKLFSIFCFIL